MTVMGKTLSEYVRFQRWVLVVILLVAVGRLALSLAGAPGGVVRPLSVTAFLLAGALFYGVRVATTGFGGYRHLLPLLVIQHTVGYAVVIFGILLAALTGVDNVYTAPEYSKAPNYWPHAAGHALGIVVVSLALWPVSALVMWATRKWTAPAPAAAHRSGL